MELFIRGVGFARQKTNNIFDWDILILILILTFILIISKNATGQSAKEKEGHQKDTAQQVYLRKYLIKDFNIVLYQSQPFGNLTKLSSGKGLSPKESTANENRFLKDMNYKLDSAWKKFDEQCRGQRKP